MLNLQSYWRPTGRNFGAPKNMGGLCFQDTPLTMPLQEPPKKKSKQVENKQGTLLSWVKPCTSDPEPGVLEETIRIKEQTEMRMIWSHRQQ